MNLALIHANQTALRASQEAIQRQRNLQKARTFDKGSPVNEKKEVKYCENKQD